MYFIHIYINKIILICSFSIFISWFRHEVIRTTLTWKTPGKTDWAEHMKTTQQYKLRLLHVTRTLSNQSLQGFTFEERFPICNFLCGKARSSGTELLVFRGVSQRTLLAFLGAPGCPHGAAAGIHAVAAGDRQCALLVVVPQVAGFQADVCPKEQRGEEESCYFLCPNYHFFLGKIRQTQQLRHLSNGIQWLYGEHSCLIHTDFFLLALSCISNWWDDSIGGAAWRESHGALFREALSLDRHAYCPCLHSITPRMKTKLGSVPNFPIRSYWFLERGMVNFRMRTSLLQIKDEKENPLFKLMWLFAQFSGYTGMLAVPTPPNSWDMNNE